MAQVEIERKFLVRDAPRELLDAAERVPIDQGYLAADGEVEVRVRRAGAAAVLTVKGGAGLERAEVELGLGPEQFASLWELTGGRRLEKVRHRIAHGGLVLEVDVYGGALEGLVVAEVEFATVAEAEAFTPPPWMGPEVTGDSRYRNAELARAGRPPDREG